jgi:LCP family protein required for cell wall assembly
MRLKKHQIITLAVFGVISLAILGVLTTGILVNALVSSPNSPYRISLANYYATPTPFQPNSYANILEDGTIEMLPQPILTPTPVPTFPVADLPKNQLNILLLGVDDFGENNFRTDVIMLLSVNPTQKTASLISFPRDLYVTIPGYYSNRINTTWSLGGWSLLQDTFEVNFGIRPERYMMVNFNGFVDVIESLGGIDVEVTAELQDNCHITPSGWCTITPGMMHMDGETALWYSRSRLTTSDFDRNRRAQEVVKAGFKKAMNMNMIFKALEFYRYYREYVDTNVQLNELIPLFPMASTLTNSDNIHHYAVSSDMVSNYITGEGAMVLLPNFDAIRGMLAEALYQGQ